MREEKSFSQRAFLIYPHIRKLGASTFSSYNKAKGRRRFDMSNSLAAVHPELVAEWSEKNLPLTPDSITFGSNKKVWWKCSLGHSWKAKISDRTILGKDCSVCESEYRSVFPGLVVAAVCKDKSISSINAALSNRWRIQQSDSLAYKPEEQPTGTRQIHRCSWRCPLQGADSQEKESQNLIFLNTQKTAYTFMMM